MQAASRQFTLTVRPSQPPPPVPGIWTSAAELASKATSGPAWDGVKACADLSYAPNIDDQDDLGKTNMLAGAIAYARTRSATYGEKVFAALNQVVGLYYLDGKPIGRTLAWARNLAAYAISADLVGYRTANFEAWLRQMTDGYLCSQLKRTMRGMFFYMPNNWGGLGFGSLVAAYAYLGDTARLADVRREWVEDYLCNYNNVNATAKRSWASDTSWYVDPKNKRIINPVGSVKQGVNIDGVLPEDTQRGGSFTPTPSGSSYPWEYLSGIIVAGRILERAGMPIWSESADAIYRCAYRTELGFGGAFKATAIHRPDIFFVNHHYGRNEIPTYSDSRAYSYGRQTGFPYVLPGV